MFHSIATLVLSAIAAFSPTEPPTITIHADQPSHTIPASLYGIFFEEINHAGDGGLYAELVRNRSFTEAPTLDAWSAVRAGSAKVNLFFDYSMPPAPVKSRSLRIEVNSTNG